MQEQDKNISKTKYLTDSEPEFTILMPCLNEERTLELCIAEARELIEEGHLSAEILIADNGSTDRSLEIARAMQVRIIHVPKTGYGAALRAGIKAAKGRYVIMGDCDYSYCFRDLSPFIEGLRQGNCLVIGNRLNTNMEPGAMPLLHRYFGVPFLSLLGRIRFGTTVQDFHCGLRGVNRDVMSTCHLTSIGMEYATEMIGALVKTGLPISQVPITYRKDRRMAPSHLRSFRDGLRHLWVILKRSE